MGFSACDSTSSPEDLLSDSPEIRNLSVTPLKVQFTLEDDGFKDTTLVFSIQVSALNMNGLMPQYSLTERNSLTNYAEGELTLSNNGFYEAQMTFETKTTSFAHLILNVFVNDVNGNANYAQSSIHIDGFSNNPPEILATDGPEEITRPSSGEIPAIFTAKVTDRDGHETLEAVFIRVINQESGEVTGSPFEMFDDGSTYDDEIANDSTFTWSLPVTQTDNNPNRDFDIEFYAIDKGGFISDTIRTTFRIRE